MKKLISVILFFCIFFITSSCSSFPEVQGDAFELISGYEWQNVKNFSEGFAAVKKDGLWGFINVEGDLAIDYSYTAVMRFSVGLCAVQYRNNGKWGFIDPDGNFSINPEYSLASVFSEGFAAVKQGNYYAYIDKSCPLLSI